MRLAKRKATQADVPFLLSLRRETLDRHLAASGADCSNEAHLALLMDHFDCAEILTHQGDPVGLLKVRREPEAWEIIQIQLSTPIQGNGIGSMLLERLVANAADAGADVKLAVLKANPAKNLYERLGFKVIEEDAHKFYMLRAT